LRVLAPTAGTDLVKETNLSWLAINPQLKILGTQAVYETTVVVENHHIGLNQRGVNSQDVLALSGRWGLFGALTGGKGYER